MITIENTEVSGFEAAIRGMRNPLNSWNKSDSSWQYQYELDIDKIVYEYVVGKNDIKLMRQLAAAGNDHGKFLRMINVTCDITAPFYYWKEADTYKVGTVANSCSTMHKLTYKKFELDDFSHEHLTKSSIAELERQIETLNKWRTIYLNGGTDDNRIYEPKEKDAWWQMIQLLPSTYNQRRTWQANYAVLRNIYHARQNHKLDEWHTFCTWIESLPLSELITGKTPETEYESVVVECHEAREYMDNTVEKKIWERK